MVRVREREKNEGSSIWNKNDATDESTERFLPLKEFVKILVQNTSKREETEWN